MNNYIFYIFGLTVFNVLFVMHTLIFKFINITILRKEIEKLIKDILNLDNKLSQRGYDTKTLTEFKCITLDKLNNFLIYLQSANI